MYSVPKVIVLWQKKNRGYVSATFALDEAFGLIQRVTGKGERSQPISAGQVTEIRQHADAEGYSVKIITERSDLENAAMEGECMLPVSAWASLR